ncbi:oligosaccharide flippase family protein [Epibacterium ulvae]|uniref:lipopolysaccharide biosynthesis protein n=1 Tax=Epibacterium ulvae TaxID=1156985 RepID=UPI001BFC853D|nr:oligosaccharide flippase family protein [Epibacterium ulvae]MBT8155918.1 oligosaccharide flippase family protein [Epibacterium ulvae]
MQAENRADVSGGSLLRTLFKKAVSLLGARVAGNLLTLGYTLILSRLATPAEFGLVMSGFSWAMLLSIGFALNVESGSIRFLVKYREDEQNAHAAGFVRFNRIIITSVSVLLALGLAAVLATGLADWSSQGVQIFLLACLAAPVVAVTRVYARHATALGQVLRGGVPIMFARPAVIFVLVGAVWLLGLEPSAVQLLALILVGFVATALLQYWLLRDTFAFLKDAPRDFSDKFKWIETGVMMAPLLVIRDNLKHVIVASAGLALAAEDVGLVALALSIMSLLYFAVKAVDISLSPQLSSACQGGNKPRVAQLIKVAAKLKVAVVAMGIVALAAAGGWILGLFGDDYIAAWAPLMAVMLIPAADAIWGPAQIVLNVSGQQRKIFAVAGLSAAILVGATAAGGWLAGAVGASAGAGLSYMMQQGILCLIANRVVGVQTSILGLLQPAPKTTV